MNAVKHYFRFCWMSWKLAWVETWRYYYKDWRGWVSSLSTAAVTIIALLLLEDTKVAENEFILLLYGVLGAIGGFLILLLISRLVAPSKLFREKEIQADLYTWNDINIGFFKHDKFSIFGDGIELKNNKPAELYNLSIYLVGVEKNRVEDNLGKKEARFGWINPKAKKLMMEGATLESDGGKKRFVIIDHKDGDEIARMDCDGLSVAIHPDVEYIVRLEIRGNIALREMPVKKMALNIFFDRDNKEIRLVRID